MPNCTFIEDWKDGDALASATAEISAFLGQAS